MHIEQVRNNQVSKQMEVFHLITILLYDVITYTCCTYTLRLHVFSLWKTIFYTYRNSRYWLFEKSKLPMHKIILFLLSLLSLISCEIDNYDYFQVFELFYIKLYKASSIGAEDGHVNIQYIVLLCRYGQRKRGLSTFMNLCRIQIMS